MPTNPQQPTTPPQVWDGTRWVTPAGATYSQGPSPNIGGLLDILQQHMAGFQPRNVDTALQAGPEPTISTGPVFGPDMVQQQVNAMRANVGQQVGTQQRNVAQSAGARGFGAESPLIAALQQQAASKGLAASTAGARDIRMNAAEQNASHVLAAQQALSGARETAFGNRQREQIQRQQLANQNPFVSTILQSLLAGPVANMFAS